jgi:hypothetical protein
MSDMNKTILSHTDYGFIEHTGFYRVMWELSGGVEVFIEIEKTLVDVDRIPGSLMLRETKRVLKGYGVSPEAFEEYCDRIRLK